MSSSEIGLGLIGAGHHGIRYARHLIQDIPDVQLRAVCRQHPEQGLDIPGSGAVSMYGRPEELIADPLVDAIILVVPPVLHKDLCLAAVAARKPVLIEKPLATSYRDACVMVDAAAQAGVPLMTAHTLRFDATIQSLLASRSRVGRPQHLVLTSHIETKERSADYADGYGRRGALVEFGVHQLDLVRVLTGEEIHTVQCVLDQIPPAHPETLAKVHLRTMSGMPCIIEVGRVAAGRVGRAEWIGSDGRLIADWTNRHIQYTDSASRSEEWSMAQSLTVLTTLREFIHALQRKTPMPITGEDGCRAVEIAEACYRSAEAEGVSVTLPLKT
ncbi:MAG: Gfo/Idh/MocA family oxidoreductase [Nitrospira sp. CG24D]|nr:MAG: Gfo/Idh/MocA family oxidoreductase [Nitrospira sp. CG24D]